MDFIAKFILGAMAGYVGIFSIAFIYQFFVIAPHKVYKELVDAARAVLDSPTDESALAKLRAIIEE